MNKTTLPLHPAQYEVYIDQLLHSKSPHYNIGLYLKLKGPLNKEKFREAVTSSPEFFDAFRMKFNFDGPDPLCSFEEDCKELEFTEMDFSDRNDAENEAKSWMQNRFNTPFIFQKETRLFEHVLIAISPNEHWFFFRYHHLIIDGYGFSIWVNFLAEKYKSLVKGNHLHLEYPRYQDEVIRAAQYRESHGYELDAQYWNDRINEKPEALLRKNNSLMSRPVKKSGNYYLDISSGQKATIEEVIRLTKSNLSQLTIAALLIYFKQITGQSEFVFGIPVHKRGLGEQRSIVGMFSGVSPLKSVIDDDITLTGLLKAIAGWRRGDYSHQNYLIVDLIRSLKINASESFLYDIIINYVPFNFNLEFGVEIRSSIYWMQSEFERLPLQVCWRDYGSQQPLELGLHYSYEYFNKEEIALLAGRLIFILEQFLTSTDLTIGEISILPDEEQQLLKKFNGSPAVTSGDQTIIDLFELQVEKTPDVIALVFEEQHLSYRQLNERANQLAHYLRSKGVKEETLVPICMERSVEMMVGILGILKAGGAYVPIDPDYPRDRISYMLTDTSAVLTVSSKESFVKLPLRQNSKVVKVDADWDHISNYPTDNVSAPVCSKHLAYIIYTSGSTGTPKGVMIEHRNVVASTLSRKAYYKSFKSLLLLPSFSFDPSVAGMFGTFLTGGCLLLCKDQSIKDARQIGNLLKNTDTVLCVPSYYNLLLQEGAVKDSGLSKVILGGENLDEQIVTRHYSKTNNISLYNEYGPTEYTVWATVAKIEDSYRSGTIGRPIPGTSVYIVGKKGYLNPVGVLGEICIAGDSLARGYLNNAELTRQKFVSNSFSEKPEDRMYRTGDLGRWLPDGNLEFIGRADDQVKIRGYRIELGEVEGVLQQCTQVRQAAVLVRDDKENGKRLVAYVVPNKDGLDLEEVNRYLISKLPQYMIPGQWVELQEFPLTANGKLDRKALPEVNAAETAGEQYEAPRTELEARLCAIWQELLEVEKVGIRHNFFKLGGDSIITIRMVSRIKSLGYSIQAQDIFFYQTIEKLATAVIAQSGAGETAEPEVKRDFERTKNGAQLFRNYLKSLVPAKVGGSKTPLYIVCGAGGTVFRFKNFVEMLDADQPVYVLQQPTDIKDFGEFPTDIKGISARYISEILTENPNGPYALAGHCIGGIIAFEMAKQMEAMGKTVKLLAMFDTVVRERKEPQPASFWDPYSKVRMIKDIFFKVYSKVRFEVFLLTKHTNHAIEYKIRTMKSLMNKIFRDSTYKEESSELKGFDRAKKTLGIAYRDYDIAPYNGDIIVFYAKDRYSFSDWKKNIRYKKIPLSDNVKNRWKPYARSATFYEVEGEHTTIFEPSHGGEQLAQKLQEYLDECAN